MRRPGWIGLQAAVGVLVVVSTAAPAPATFVAQSQQDALAAVEQIFDGMRTANADMVREVFADDARFAMIDAQATPRTVRVQATSGWIEAIARSEGRWDEQLYDVEAQVDGAMASVWAPYTFYLDGAISHCGINSIEMLHDGRGWKVTQISDTRRTTDCPDPHGAR